MFIAKRPSAASKDETTNEFLTSVDYVLEGFSTKKISSNRIYAYGEHKDPRMVGEGSVWKLHVYPLQVEKKNSVEVNSIGIFLSLESVWDIEAECIITLRLRSPSGETLKTHETERRSVILGKRNGKAIYPRGWNSAFSHEDIEKCMLFDDTLHIRVDIRYGIISGGSAAKRSTPSAIFLNLLQKQGGHESGDVLLTSFDCREIRAHKFVLSMHSTVFAAMFQHPFKETVTGSVLIEDLDGETISAMISYMYGKDEWNPKLAEKLVVAANKYKIDPLENACVEELINQLNVENVLRIFMIADEHDLELLQVKCLDFIAQNILRICASGGLIELQENGSLAMLKRIQERCKKELNEEKSG